MGRFNMGSTVILLMPPGANAWDRALRPGDTVRVGQRLGWLGAVDRSPPHARP
jgi:phosphatidylserine decarboxylase